MEFDLRAAVNDQCEPIADAPQRNPGINLNQLKFNTVLSQNSTHHHETSRDKQVGMGSQQSQLWKNGINFTSLNLTIFLNLKPGSPRKILASLSSSQTLSIHGVATNSSSTYLPWAAVAKNATAISTKDFISALFKVLEMTENLNQKLVEFY